MPPEIKNAMEQFNKSLADFRAENDKALSEMKANGRISAETAEKVDRLNARVTEMQAMVEEVQKQAQRVRPAEGQEHDPKKAEHRNAFLNFARRGTQESKNVLASLQAAVKLGDDTAGGYAVPETLDLQIERAERDNTPLRGIFGSMTLSNESYKKLVADGEAEGGWVGEEEERAETGTPTLKELAPYFGEVYAEPHTTQRALDDMAIDVEKWLSDEVGFTFGQKETYAFTMGNGVKKPKGILSYSLSTDADGTRAFGSIQKILSGSAGAFVADKLIDVVHALHANYRMGARWMMSNLSLAAIRKLKDGQGNYLWQNDFASGPSGTLLNYPIVENHVMPSPAADANAVLFGNYQRAYMVYDLRGVRVIRDEITKKGFVKFYTTKRLGGMLIQDRALKVLTLSA